MRVFRSLALHSYSNFCQMDKILLRKFLITASIYLTGPHGVDNFLLPTLLIHQFEGADREGEV